MKIFTQLSDLNHLQLTHTSVALGTFDGVHIGHQKIIRQVVESAVISGGASVVFTFSNHPLAIINPRRCPPQIVTPEYKAELIDNLGADILLSIPFTQELLQLSPVKFIELLTAYLHPSHLIIGPNYRFGYKGMGTPSTLKTAGLKYGFSVMIHPAVYIDKFLVSSTSIRKFIHEGNISQATRLLGRPPRIASSVISGDGRGRILGYPTANIAVEEGLVVPGNGVYAVYVRLGERLYKGVANIGTNPTFKGKTRKIEVYLLDFAGTLYGQTILVDFIQKLRNEQAFSSAEKLAEQIKQDIKDAYKYYK